MLGEPRDRPAMISGAGLTGCGSIGVQVVGRVVEVLVGRGCDWLVQRVGWEWSGYERAGHEWIRMDFLITVEENGGC